MESYFIEWLNLLGRWFHMITGVAWIGASFYFVWLDNHLLPPKKEEDTAQGVAGEVWSVHGGGFYHAQKYKLAPPTIPSTLHWFKWEAYTTWLSGVFLLALMYWYGAEIYTIDASVMALSKPHAIVIGMATLIGGWLVYDFLCRSKMGQNEKALGFAVAIFVCVMAYVLCQVFSGRAAYIHFGAMLGTIMVANVFFIIIPGQKALVKAAETGGELDPIHGLTAKQRSVHNTFFTLPVLFVMISNHYAMTYAHSLNWLILIGICMVGGLVRIYFVQRHFGKQTPLPLVIAAILLAAIAALAAPKPTISTAQQGEALSHQQLFTQVKPVIVQRCATCHAAAPTQAGFTAAPKGVLLETDEQISSQASLIHTQTVLSKAMPIGNLTQMTDDERNLVDQWFNSLPK
ncbi:MAG: putative membrane protein [Saprospiraceae bacterium]|jgi:uncharacterized membrane protein